MLGTIRRCLDEHNYMVDPHTAVAMAAAWKFYPTGIPNNPIGVLATASPCKFEAAMKEAIGKDRWKAYEVSADFPEPARELLRLPEKPIPILRAVAQGGLDASQAVWETTVRQALDAPATRARL